MGTEHGTSAGYSLACAIAKQTVWWADATGQPANGDYANGGLYLADEGFSDEREYKQVPGATGQPAQAVKTRRRAGKIMPSGSFRTGLTADRANLLMEMVFGKIATNTSSFDNAAALPGYSVAINKAGVSTMIARNFRSNRASFGSNDGDGDLMLSVEGFLTHLETSGMTYPTGVAAPATDVFQHWESVLTIAGTAYKFKSIEFTIDHDIQGDVFRNMQTRIALPKGMRKVTALLEVDWSTTGKALYDLWLANTYFTTSLAYTSSAKSMTFASAASGAVFIGETPKISQSEMKVPLRLPIQFCATNTAQDDELTCVVVP